MPKKSQIELIIQYQRIRDSYIKNTQCLKKVINKITDRIPDDLVPNIGKFMFWNAIFDDNKYVREEMLQLQMADTTDRSAAKPTS